MKVAIIIPCFNEEKNISDVIHSVNILNFGPLTKVIPVVINDHSTDKTSIIAQNENCILLNLPVNLGIGGAVQTGFKYAYEHQFDIAVQLDGDGQHPADEIEKIISPIIKGEADIVIGSRFITGIGFQSSSMRRIGIRIIRFLIKKTTGNIVHDPTSGFRAINTKTLQIVSNNYPDDYPEPTALIIYNKHHLRVQEIQVEMKPRQGGTSSISGFSTLYYMLKVSLSILFTSLKR